jgi:hypothetical protein
LLLQGPEEFEQRKALILLRDEEIKLIRKPGELFGDTYKLNEDMFQRSIIYAKTEVKCLQIEQEDLIAFLTVNFSLIL